MKKIRKKIEAKADINVTPFIDILLVLLVIFMTRRFRNRHRRVPLPRHRIS